MINHKHDAKRMGYMLRPRVTALLADAAAHPLSVVLAGAGCGKTVAVHDFAASAGIPFTWTQFSEQDNAGSRFWATFVKNFDGWDEAYLEHCRSIGFPDTEDKLNLHIAMRNRYVPDRRYLYVLDDIHLITNPDILHFFTRAIHAAYASNPIILICRELPGINIEDLQIREVIPTITEDELCFTESELARFFALQGLSVPDHSLRNIYADTKGWAIAVNLIARSLKKSPGYEGYVRVAMKQNIFKMMELESDAVSEKTRRFKIRLSLIDHLAADLIDILAEGDTELLADFKRQNAYIRFNSFINAYVIHHLFLEFLQSKQHILTREETDRTYRAAAGWCAKNGFITDALKYYENVGDFEDIVTVLAGLPVQMSYDIAALAADILERASETLADKIEGFAVTRVRILIRIGKWDEALALMRKYEERFMPLDQDDPFRNRTLGMIYYAWGNLRALMSTTDHHYDFDGYYAKMNACLTKATAKRDQYADLPLGFWVSLIGSPAGGAPQAYIDAEMKAVGYVSQCLDGAASGIDTLCQGELNFYQGNFKEAETLITLSLREARENKLCEVEHKALFYKLRLAILRGDYKDGEDILKEIKTRLGIKCYCNHYFNYDMTLAWYFCALRRPDLVPSWLRERFSPYNHAYYIDNTGNQIKARVHYLQRNFPPLLAYIEDMKGRESILYGRVEMLAMKACVLYQMKKRDAALRSLREAYETAAPNGIITPFIERGKDMRTLASAALRGQGSGIPEAWLNEVKRRSATFAKFQSLMITDYEKVHGRKHKVSLTAREREILKDMYGGFSRSQIAAKQALSENTVNSSVSSIFNKLGARNAVDAVRIAAEEGLV
ncbi:MAG: LuxR C-terminal-related transcriptional regulator [Clostridiales bacterium]|nr:LuxR C-terminal-related transcriptional regulator [Clostridiales bacterium]